MSASSNWFNEAVKTVPLMLLGAAGAYYAYQAISNPPKKQRNTTKDVKTETTPHLNQAPQILRDPDTGEYFVLESGSDTPRAITVDEIYELTGSRPIEEEPTSNQEPSPQPTQPQAQADETPARQEPVVIEPETAVVPENIVVPETIPESETIAEPERPAEIEPIEPEPIAPVVPDLIRDPIGEPLIDDVPEPVPAPAPVQRVIGLEDFEEFANDEVDMELERANQRLPVVDQPVAGPGPATANNNRIVGTKKAKSLERKDQRRAYNEHIRMVAMVDKQDEEEFQKKHGDAIAAEREERRLLEEEAVRERKEQQRKQKEEEEALKREKELVRESLDSLQPGAVMPLETEIERELAQSMFRSSNGTHAPYVVGDGNWLVKLSDDDLKKLASTIKASGAMTYSEIAESLTNIKKQ